MKLLVLLTLVGFCTCQAAVSAQNSKITLSATNTTLASVFRQIEQLTDYMFIYKSGDIAPFTDITIDRRQTEVNRILDECLSGTGLSYTFKDNLIIIQGATQQAEEKKVNGKITDRQGHPLPGVTVMIKGTQMGVVTDANGKYTIALPDAKDIFLRFTFIGMKPQEIAYTGQKEINVTLHEEATEMDEVVVTGYQVIDKRKNTSAVTTVKVDDIMIPAATSIDQMLEGRVPGMILMSNSGEVGVVPKIRIRGTSTLIGNREPLWVVDGIIVQDPVPISPEELNDPDYINRIGNAIAGLNPQDIERLDILKDAAATALYGAKAANGVIVVTTKKGHVGAPIVNYNMTTTFRQRPRYTDRKINLMNSRERIQFSRELFDNHYRYIAEKFNHKFTYNEAICGAHAIDEVGDPFPEETFKTCMDADAVLFAAVGDPRFDNNPTAKVRPEQGLLAMRKKLGLFANVRPVATFDCLLHKSPLKDELLKGADFVVIRELTGGMYFGEKYQDNDKAYDTDIYTRPEIERILKVAFEFAMKRNKHLTVVDKANVLASSRLWRQIAKEMEPQYPEVNTDYMFIDNASMRVLTEPTFFDVIVTENTFGDILTDETSCITGSMGLQPSSSLGEHTPLFEPVHGSWPQAAGKNLANPVAQILSAAMLLEHFGLNEEGALIRKAVDASLDANVRTPEIQVEGGAQYGTTEVGAWIVNWIKNA